MFNFIYHLSFVSKFSVWKKRLTSLKGLFFGTLRLFCRNFKSFFQEVGFFCLQFNKTFRLSTAPLRVFLALTRKILENFHNSYSLNFAVVRKTELSSYHSIFGHLLGLRLIYPSSWCITAETQVTEKVVVNNNNNTVGPRFTAPLGENFSDYVKRSLRCFEWFLFAWFWLV